MNHPLHRVTAFRIIGTTSLRVEFSDGLSRDIDFDPILHGELYGPLRNPEVFKRVQLDAEAGTLCWPNGADFDPATLHDWPEVVSDLAARARGWT